MLKLTKTLLKGRVYDKPTCNANLQPEKHYKYTLNLYKQLYRNCWWNGQKDPGLSRLVRLEFEKFRWQEDEVQIMKLHKIGEKYRYYVYKGARNAITNERTWHRLFSTRNKDGSMKSKEKLLAEEKGRNFANSFPTLEMEKVRGIMPSSQQKTSKKKMRWIRSNQTDVDSRKLLTQKN